MKSILRRIKDVVRQDFVETFNNLYTRPKLKDKQEIERFYNLNCKYSKVCNSFYENSETLEKKSVGYDWGSWSGKIRKVFEDGVAIDFLSASLISFTMVYKRISGVEATKQRIELIQNIFDLDTLKIILKEDYIGLPTISNSDYMTSSNRTHHVTHLAFYKKMITNNFWDTKSIIEFGGGYGNMARIIRKMNPKVTYIIVDLPELLALQYIYLGALESEDEMNIVNLSNTKIIENKINLVSSELVYNGDITLDAESFISTWALSECPKYLQEFVISQNFFNAKKLLIASFIDENNVLNSAIKFEEIKKQKVPFLDGNHEYWTR